MFGVSRYYLRPETGEAEFALVVNDAYQRQRLGRHLLERLIAVARERGVKKLVGLILAQNGPMLALSTALGFRAKGPAEEGVVEVELALQETPAPAADGESPTSPGRPSSRSTSASASDK
jgi:acetyltransferase